MGNQPGLHGAEVSRKGQAALRAHSSERNTQTDRQSCCSATQLARTRFERSSGSEEFFVDSRVEWPSTDTVTLENFLLSTEPTMNFGN